MMKKKTVRLISCIIAGILVAAMVFSMIASGLVYAGAVSSKELKSKLSDLEDQKTSVKAERRMLSRTRLGSTPSAAAISLTRIPR